MEALVITSEGDLRRIIREELRAFFGEGTGAGPAQDEPLMTREEIADYLHISLVTLRKWVRQGLPEVRKGGRVLFLKSEVLASIRSRPKNHRRKGGK